MRKILARALVALPLVALAGCGKIVEQLDAGTTALINFNSALITLDLTIVGNMQAQARQLAPLVCGGISLGQTIAADPKVAADVNAYLAKHERQGEVVAVATELCGSAGLPANVTSVPNATIPAGASSAP